MFERGDGTALLMFVAGVIVGGVTLAIVTYVCAGGPV